MNCEKVRNLLPDYTVELLDARRRSAVSQHLDACPACQRELEALDQAMNLVETHAVRTPPPGLWNRVYNEITSAETAAQADGRLSPWEPAAWNEWWRQLRRWWAPVAAVGATAVLALVLVGKFGEPQRPVGNPPSTYVSGEVAALVRQHALTEAEGPFGNRAVWEVETTALPQAERPQARASWQDDTPVASPRGGVRGERSRL